MKNFVVIILFLFSGITSYPAGESLVHGTRSAGIGGISVVSQDFWSAGNNPAGLGFIKGIHAGLWAENRFMLKGLSQIGAGMSLNIQPGTFGLAFSHYGSADYGEMTAGISFSRMLGRGFSAGVRMSLLNLHIGNGYSSILKVTSALGFQYQPDRRWILGVAAENLIPVTISAETKETLPITIKTGISGTFSNNFRVLAEAEKSLEHPLILKIGFEYSIVTRLTVQMGYITNPGSVTAGVSTSWNRLEIGIAGGYHPVLGWSPRISVQAVLNREKR